MHEHEWLSITAFLYLLIPSRAQTVVGLCRWAYLSKIQLSNMMGREVYIPAFELSVDL